MKKVIASINISVITILLLISCIMVYFSSSKSRELFGYTVLLYHPINTPVPSLYIVNRSLSTLNVGDEVILNITDKAGKTTVIIDKIIQITDNILVLSQNNATIDLSSTDFTIKYNKIAYKNAILGRMIFAVTKDLSPILVCVIILGGTIIVSLIWMIVVIKRKTKSTYFTPNPLEVFIDDEQTTNNSTDSVPTASLSYEQEDVSLIIVDNTKQAPTDPLANTLSLDINALLDEIIATANKDFISHQHDDMIP